MKNDKRRQPTQTRHIMKNDKRQQPTQTETIKNGGAKQTPRTPEPEATPGTAKSAPAAAQPTNRLDIVRIRGVILRARAVIHRICNAGRYINRDSKDKDKEE
jgi:hypothetical protein